MEQIEDQLEQFETGENTKNKNKLVAACITISAIHNIISIAIILLSFYSFKLSYKEIFLNPIFYIQILFFRIIPIAALILLLLKKKSGWTLTIIVSVYDVLQKINIPVTFFNGLNTVPQTTQLIILVIFSTLIMSAVLIWLLLNKKILLMFSINKTRLYSGILAGIAWFILIKFIVSPLLLNLAKKT